MSEPTTPAKPIWPTHVTLIDDGSGDPPAVVHGDQPLTPEGEKAMRSLIAAAKRLQAEEDAADPEGAAERVRRQAASIARIRERNARLRGGSGVGGDGQPEPERGQT